LTILVEIDTRVDLITTRDCKNTTVVYNITSLFFNI
jgi:hypothetical protein